MTVRRHAANSRLEEARRSVRELEREQPLRRRILTALAEAPRTTSQLAAEVEATPEAVSRKLKELREEDLVESDQDADDRRRRINRLTRQGEIAYVRHLSLGEPEELPTPPDAEEVGAFLREGVEEAVELRRKNNRLDDAIERLALIEKHAGDLGDHELAIEAGMELATTQRQRARHEDWLRSVAALRNRALHDAFDPELTLRATAYIAYQRGRSNHANAIAELVRSISTFSDLIEVATGKEQKALMKTRRAWSVFGLANACRKRSDLESAIRLSVDCAKTFERLRDDYGKAQSCLLLGSSLRLQGHFNTALKCFTLVSHIAQAPGNGFERTAITALQQTGEVRRCIGQFNGARDALDEALERSRHMGLDSTMALASASLAALEFQEGDPEKALFTMKRADEPFMRSGDTQGIGLNARRQATVARHLLEEGRDGKGWASWIKRLVARAKESYAEMDSPAGMAQCEVEQWRLAAVSKTFGDRRNIMKRLNQLVERNAVAIYGDFWTSEILAGFERDSTIAWSDEVQSARLLAQLSAEKAGKEIRPALNSIGIKMVRSSSTPGDKAVEMAGECKRAVDESQLAGIASV